jgi:hypothetical protein
MINVKSISAGETFLSYRCTMLDHLRRRVVESLSAIHSATLSTYGAAELQAALLPCESLGLRLYILMPATSDHLLNLKGSLEVVVTSADWQLRGTAVLLETVDFPDGLALLSRPEAQWSRLVEVKPYRVHIRRQNGWGFSETIDIDE